MDFANSNLCDCCGISFEHSFGAGSLCPECISSTPEFDKARFVFKYNDFAGSLITKFKYSDKTYLSALFTEMLSNLIVRNQLGEEFDFITSVPISRKRLFTRKYNQSAILANQLSAKHNIPVDNQMLYRVKNIPPQTTLRRKDRLKNVKNAFHVPKNLKNYIKNSRVILVDDVFTTGATLNECAKTLKANGVKEVFAITLARTYLT